MGSSMYMNQWEEALSMSTFIPLCNATREETLNKQVKGTTCHMDVRQPSSPQPSQSL